jgi:FtsH-binding integral membrane protein
MNNPYTGNERAVSQASTEASTIFLAKVFNWMAIGLGLTGLIAFLTINSQTALQMLFTVQDGYAKPNMLLYGLLIGELGLVFYCQLSCFITQHPRLQPLSLSQPGCSGQWLSMAL